MEVAVANTSVAPLLMTSVFLRVLIVALAAGRAAAGSDGTGTGTGGANSKIPRGVDPASSAAARYLESRFACDGGATVIDAARVNDDYCDCKDGTDEPGAPPEPATAPQQAPSSEPNF